MSKIAVRITQFRKGSGYADAFFTSQIGMEDEAGVYTALVDIRDCELRTAQSGERYIRFPSKPRIKKVDADTAAYQKDATGKVIYDSLVDSPREKKEGTEEWFPTNASRQFKDSILQQVLKQSGGQAAEASGRGSGARASKPRPATVSATSGSSEVGTPLAGDNDLPF